MLPPTFSLPDALGYRTVTPPIPQMAANNIVPFHRMPQLPRNNIVPYRSSGSLPTPLVSAAAKLPVWQRALNALGTLANVATIGLAIAELAQFAEQNLAPQWFQWLEETTGFKVRQPLYMGARNGLNFVFRRDVATRIRVTGQLFARWRPRWPSNSDWIGWNAQIVTTTPRDCWPFAETATISHFSIWGERIPLSGSAFLGFSGWFWLHGISVCLSDNSCTHYFDLVPSGPSRDNAGGSADVHILGINVNIEVIYPDERVGPSITINGPEQNTPKVAVRGSLEQGAASPNRAYIGDPIPQPDIVIPTKSPDIEQSPFITPSKDLEKEPLILRPSGVPKRVREILASPEPSLESIAGYLDRLLEKECPDPCPPCEHKEPEDGGQDGGDTETPAPVVLFWVEKDEQGQCALMHDVFAVNLPPRVVQGIERTAKNLYKVCDVEPVIAGRPEDEAPWKPPIGEHLKVIWIPDDSIYRGYYYFRVPHWRLSFEETIALDWDSLRWIKGLRNCLEVRFSTGKKMTLYGESFENLEAIFDFCLQGITTGISFEIRRTTSSVTTTNLSLKVRKLEYWTGRAGHAAWYTWYPPLLIE